MSTVRNEAHPSVHGYEFGGPTGALAITVGLPVFTYFILFACNDVSGCPAPSLLHPTSFTTSKFAEEIGWVGWDTIFNIKTFLVTLGYYATTLFFYSILPATEVFGSELRNGHRIRYHFNAFNTCMAMLAILAAGTVLQGADFVVWTFITGNYFALLTSNMIIATVLAIYSYANSFSLRSDQPLNPAYRELALGGMTGNVLYDWFIGRELNPPFWVPGIGYIDLKTYMETRPGLTGWLIMNLAFVAGQYRNYGYVTDSMLLTVFSQAVYVLDSFWNEPLILTQIDITTDGFGFMLAFGDLVWVPFTFSIQARYLSIYPNELGMLNVVGILVIQLFGYYIFRMSNSQKDTFRTKPNDPSVRELSFIQTRTGSKLLTSGWWGAARHINYLGDWLFSWAYCLPTGFAGYIIQQPSSLPVGSGFEMVYVAMPGSRSGTEDSMKLMPGEARGWGMLVTYFYLLYFAVLLVHRQRRDDAKCLRKYGKDWEEYVRRVPSRIIPGIY